MFNPAAQLEAAVTARARKGARRAGLLLVSGLLLVTGAGFLTVAMWIVAAAAWSPAAAALMLGAIYLGGGGIVMALAFSGGRTRPAGPDPAAPQGAKPGTANPYPSLATAFVFGLDTAVRLRRARDR